MSNSMAGTVQVKANLLMDVVFKCINRSQMPKIYTDDFFSPKKYVKGKKVQIVVPFGSMCLNFTGYFIFNLILLVLFEN